LVLLTSSLTFVFCPYQWIEGEWNFRAILMSWIFATWQVLLCTVVTVTNTWFLIPQLFMRRPTISLVFTRVATLTRVVTLTLKELKRNTRGFNWFLEFRESMFYVQVAFQPVVFCVVFHVNFFSKRSCHLRPLWHMALMLSDTLIVAKGIFLRPFMSASLFSLDCQNARNIFVLSSVLNATVEFWAPCFFVGGRRFNSRSRDGYPELFFFFWRSPWSKMWDVTLQWTIILSRYTQGSTPLTPLHPV
jgi:hypothetical protein